ncbi:MAG: DKNYY domain-containing protein [Limnohabitans sp.]|nr:DKNYY domain-containing protein [Limnohabitans sp.]
MLSVLLLLTLGVSCYNYKSIDKNGMVWIKTNYDLWKSIDGKLAVQSFDVSDLTSKKEIFIDRFTNGKQLKNIIDTTSFEYLGNYFYKDKNYIYYHYDTSDGGNFHLIEDADPKTFTLIGWYAKDKKSIYDPRHGKLDKIDYQTFKTSEEVGSFAKDKNGYYFWGENIDTLDADNELKETINILNEME